MPENRRNGGFTLIELVIAVGLIGGAFLTMLELRTSAIDRAFRFNRLRVVQRVAQEKLDEVVFGIEENTLGEIEDRTDWEWEAQIYSIAESDSLSPLLECNLTLRYPGLKKDEVEEYVISTRFFADETHPLHQYATEGIDSGLNDGSGF